MLNFLKSTVVNRLIPKEKLVKKLNLSPALKGSLKDDIRKITITNEMSPKTMNIAGGKNVSAVFMIEVQLKQKDTDYKLIEALGKQIKQNIVFVLRHENAGQLALYRNNRLYQSDWTDYSTLNLDISGADFDEVWSRIVMGLALNEQFREDFGTPNDTSGVDELLEKQEQRKKLEREIAALEKKIKKETQFNLQAKMKKELAKLKEGM